MWVSICVYAFVYLCNRVGECDSVYIKSVHDCVGVGV